jgi:hypothetical protein
MRAPWVIGAAVIALAMTAGSADPPSGSPEDQADRLGQAVGFLTAAGGTDVAFTDWERIRASQEAQDLTGDSSLDAKMAFLMATSQDEAAASGFALARFRGHREAWGFDTLDLDWEATYSVDGPPVVVLRFRDGFDLGSVGARFDERGFSSTEVRGAIVRSHEMDPTSDWLTSTEFAILNTAFLDDGHTLVLSSGADVLHEVLAARYRRGSATPPAVLDALAALEGASAAWMGLGPLTCLGFTPAPFDVVDPRATLRPVPSGEPLHPYTILGIGYARPGWHPMGRVVMGFLDHASAQADLEPRAGMARTGISLRAGVPYSETLFTLQDANVDGTSLVLHVAPLDDIPRRLLQMLQTRDMAFAGC